MIGEHRIKARQEYRQAWTSPPQGQTAQPGCLKGRQVAGRSLLNLVSGAFPDRAQDIQYGKLGLPETPFRESGTG
jgi:hypothetical protein